MKCFKYALVYCLLLLSISATSFAQDETESDVEEVEVQEPNEEEPALPAEPESPLEEPSEPVPDDTVVDAGKFFFKYQCICF